MVFDRASLEAAGAALVQPERGLWIAPIRHHSPACAWALRALIREIRPTQVLIEGPEDFSRHIDAVLDPRTRPPVAILGRKAAGRSDRKRAFVYPLSTHAPELIALQEGRAAGAALRFIDLASGEGPEEDPGDPALPASIPQDSPFTTGAYVAALCARTSRRDGHDLWDHLFESRLGTADWRGFFADLGAYCLGLRAASPPDARILAREARMAARIGAALAEGGRVVAVVGGYHAAALTGDLPAAEPAPPPGPAAESCLIRYGFAALDALGGYASGMPWPGFYDRLWRAAEAAAGPPDWRAATTALLVEFAAAARAEGDPAPPPMVLEAARLAESLALLRGRPGPLREELREAVRMAFAKGEPFEAERREARLAGLLRGEGLGEIPPGLGAPPLVEEVRARAKALRFDLSDGVRRARVLETRRKPAHRAASEFLRALEILEAEFAIAERAPTLAFPPDPARLHEQWSYAWSGRVEANLVAASLRGETLASACLGRLTADYDALDATRRRDLSGRLEILARGLRAGFGAEMVRIASRLEADLRAASEFAPLAAALRGLLRLKTSALPQPPDPSRLIAAAFQRLVRLCDDLAATPEAARPEALEALGLVADLLRGPEGADLDGAAFAAALDRFAADPQAPPELLGGALGICVLAGRRSEAELAAALRSRLRGGESGAALLAGAARAAPSLLAAAGPALEAVEEVALALDETDFLTLLPALRRAFAGLPAPERASLSARLARRLGRTARPTAADLRRGASASAAVRALIAAEDLGDWLEGGP